MKGTRVKTEKQRKNVKYQRSLDKNVRKEMVDFSIPGQFWQIKLFTSLSKPGELNFCESICVPDTTLAVTFKQCRCLNNNFSWST